MYNDFFGFKEKPFNLVPDPAYLFLSKSHEEALAHLNYAVSQGEGFVEITGEVGTGKTTLCRAFFKGLGPECRAAYIFNPKIGPKQLIKAIHDEFEISPSGDDLKSLIDRLNLFLLEQKQKGNKVLLLIDEAQNLRADVLEQLRLLSNLETHKEKLLQIILVGQPELSDILDSYELRQIGQRIALRCRISPLNFEGTRNYIHYRLRIATQNENIKFSRAAARRIYKYSRGIPRVINVACDRTLLTAYGLGTHKITSAVAKSAVKELISRTSRRPRKVEANQKAFLLVAVAAVLIALVYFRPMWDFGVPRQASQPSDFAYAPTRVAPVPDPPVENSKRVVEAPPVETVTRKVNQAPEDIQPTEIDENKAVAEAVLTPGSQMETTPLEANLAAQPLAAEPSVAPVPRIADFSDYVANVDRNTSRHVAFLTALKQWEPAIEASGVRAEPDTPIDEAYFRLSAMMYGFSMVQTTADLDLLKQLDLPAILAISTENKKEPIFVTLCGMNGEKLQLKADDNLIVQSSADELKRFWDGTIYIPWKNFMNIDGTIPLNASPYDIVGLKMLLNEFGFKDIPINTEYDAATRKVIEAIQRQYLLTVDGLIGPLTKIAVYKKADRFDMPSLKPIKGENQP